MRRSVVINSILLLTGMSMAAQIPLHLDEVKVTARRPMKEIGIQKTAIDSTALKESISLSMADILAYNSSIYVKNYGRGTLSTVSFRGTSPSHTQVTWNGLSINSPMLGMTDFSTIPSYFIDGATLLHGASSVNEAGGGPGGAIKLATMAADIDGWNAQVIQGVGSFKTFDEFARVSYGSMHWQSSTRLAYTSSRNDYTYVNHDKKVNVYDDDKNIISQYHPTERNRHGAFHDFNILQEVYFNSLRGDRVGLNAWLTASNRELPMLSTDYGNATGYSNVQRERALRAVLSWEHDRTSWHTSAKAGYIHSRLAYDYSREVTSGNWAQMTRSRSRVNTLYAQAEGDYTPTPRWLLTANMSVHQHFVRSEDRNSVTQIGEREIIGYDKGRAELSGAISAKWMPSDRLGFSAVVREETAGDRVATPIPALFMDAVLSRPGNIMLRASATRNHKFPSLNDLYFMPGGNPGLRDEKGWTWDCGLSTTIKPHNSWGTEWSATWFDSRITDWILWLPTPKGFFSPRNVKEVHAYGAELKGHLTASPLRDLTLRLNGNLSWTRSLNQGEKLSSGDKSVGKQLPYIPEWSSSVTGEIGWRGWSMLYKWCFYSERFTMSSNDHTLTGRLPGYYMNNVTIGKIIPTRPADLSLKLAVNNLFDEDYLSVLSRPMPGINFEFFISITPKI